jgi:hypothetical protein
MGKNNQKKTTEQFKEELFNINPNIEVLGAYVNNHTKIKCKCKIDGNMWEPKPAKLLIGQGCPICKLKKQTDTHRKPHDQFIREASEVNPDIEVLGTYVNTKTKILCLCKNHNKEWRVKPEKLLIGQGCPVCKITKTANKKRKPYDQFILQLSEINPNIEVLGEYVNNRTPLKVRCKIDGNVWEPTAGKLLSGSGCPKCSGVYRRSHDEFVEELFQINPNIEVLGKFSGRHTNIWVRCKIHNHPWEPTAGKLLIGRGCPICGLKKQADTRRKPYDQFIHELSEINPNIEVLGEYVNNNTTILCRCKLGHEWKPIPSSLLSGHGCPICNGGVKKEHDEFVEKMSKINPNIEVLSTYVNCKYKIICRCKLGHEWETIPSSLLRGRGCPQCAREQSSSKNEKLLLGLIQEEYPQLIVEPNNRTIIDPLEIDIAIHDIKLYIEWNGSYWHSKPDAITKDNLKKEILKDNLIQIIDDGGEDPMFVLEQFHNIIKPEIDKRLL